jgi:predicted transcriptional regulator
MGFESFLRTKPVAFKTDLLSRVRNLMTRHHLYEMPVVSEEELLGTIRLRTLIEMLDRTEFGSLIANELVTKDFLVLSSRASVAKLVKLILKTKVQICCIAEDDRFVGYVRRQDLLNLLLNSTKPIHGLLLRDFVTLELGTGLKQLVQLALDDKPILVTKGKESWSAFLPEELQFLIFMGDYLTRKYERDFETLRADQREFLRMRIDQQLLSYLKEKPLSYYPLLSLKDIANQRFFVPSDARVGRVARLMLDSRKLAIATDEGIISDLALLRSL